jgi:hypothetical protein
LFKQCVYCLFYFFYCVLWLRIQNTTFMQKLLSWKIKMTKKFNMTDISLQKRSTFFFQFNYQLHNSNNNKPETTKAVSRLCQVCDCADYWRQTTVSMWIFFVWHYHFFLCCRLQQQIFLRYIGYIIYFCVTYLLTHLCGTTTNIWLRPVQLLFLCYISRNFLPWNKTIFLKYSAITQLTKNHAWYDPGIYRCRCFVGEGLNIAM